MHATAPSHPTKSTIHRNRSCTNVYGYGKHASPLHVYPLILLPSFCHMKPMRPVEKAILKPLTIALRGCVSHGRTCFRDVELRLCSCSGNQLKLQVSTYRSQTSHAWSLDGKGDGNEHKGSHDGEDLMFTLVEQSCTTAGLAVPLLVGLLRPEPRKHLLNPCFHLITIAFRP